MHTFKNLSLVALLLQLILVLQTFFQYQICCDDEYEVARKSLEIRLGPIGGSPAVEYHYPPPQKGYCPPSSSSPPEPIYPYESRRIKIVYPVIQEFKKKVTHDPFGITNTWVGPDICNKYMGFFCDTAPDLNQTAIAAIDFNGYNLAGPELTLSGFLDQLPDIAIFHANSNNFTGSVPKSIANLRFLYELDLSNNVFTGEFPNELIFGAKNLSFLDLRFNRFSGLLPPQVFLLGLDILFVNNNNFMQKIPDTLGCGKFYYLSLANNNLSGSIPSSIGDLKHTLVEILLFNNQLSGCLPCQIGLLGKLTLFDASRNQLTGLIPASFGCLAQLELLNLAQNQLFGHIPESFCMLPKLANVSLSQNYFTNVGPLCKNLIWRRVIDVRMNCIAGLPAQRSPADCHAFLSKHKCCSDEKFQTWIPCGAHLHSNALHHRPSTAAVPKSYRALAPQKKPTRWTDKFDASTTKDDEFHLLDGSSIQVPFMTSKKKQLIRAFDGFKVLGLPYKQGGDKRQFSMYFFLPDAKDGLPKLVEEVISVAGFLDRHIPYQKVEVGEFRIPKFKISFGFEASEVLKELGLVLPFSGDGLTEMVDSPMGQKLYVSNIFHKSFIEVNEEGTEAAAASAAVIKLRSL